MTTFTFKTYQEQAMLTNKAEYDALYNRKHAGYGLVTEVGEIVDAFKRLEFYKKPLDLVNLKEEVGDALWYVALGYQGLERCMDENNLALDNPLSEGVTTEWLLKKLSYHASCVLKFHDEEDTISIDYDLSRIVTYLHNLALLHDFTLEEACALNIEKLRKRFPNGFTEYDAINRNKVEELSHFDQNQEGEPGFGQGSEGRGDLEEGTGSVESSEPSSSVCTGVCNESESQVQGVSTYSLTQ